MATATTSSGDSTKPETSATSNDSSLLDLVFAIDCTGSMGTYIKEARTNIRAIVEEIFSKETNDVRLALVQYRDHPPEDETFVTLVNDFTPSVKKMKSWLEGCSASGGGDTPEAVADALHQVLKLSWRSDATKLCVFIADAPPHGINCSSDHFPNGCPDGLDPMVITQQLAELGVCLYTVGCEPSINEYRQFFKALSHMTGGQYVPLKKANLLPAVIVGGAMEEISLDRWQADADDEIEVAMRDREDDDVDETALVEQVYARLRGKGAQTMQLQKRKKALPSAGDRVKTLAGLTKLKDVRTEMTNQKRQRRRGRSRSGDRDRRRSRSHSRGRGRRSRSRSRDRGRRSRSRSRDRGRRSRSLSRDRARRSRSRSRDRDRRSRSRSLSRSDESDDDGDAAYGVVEHDLDMVQTRRMVGKYLKKKKR